MVILLYLSGLIMLEGITTFGKSLNNVVSGNEPALLISLNRKLGILLKTQLLMLKCTMGKRIILADDEMFMSKQDIIHCMLNIKGQQAI